METRHTMHRSLRSGGASLVVPSRGRTRIRGYKHAPSNKTRTKVPVILEKTQSSKEHDTEKIQNFAQKPTSSREVLEKQEEQVAHPQVVGKPSDSTRKVTSSVGQVSLEQSTRRSRFRGRGGPLTSRGKSYIPNLKSKVDWSRNTDDDSAEDSDSTVVSNEAKNVSSTTCLRSRSLETSSLAQGAKVLSSSSSSSKINPLSVVSRLRSDSPSKSPVARIKSTTGSDSSPSSRTRSRIVDDLSSTKSSPATRLRRCSTDSTVRSGPAVRSRVVSNDDASKGSQPAKAKSPAAEPTKLSSTSTSGASTRSGGVGKAGMDVAKMSENAKHSNVCDSGKVLLSNVDSNKKPLKVIRTKRQMQSPRTQSMSPVSRTRSGTPIGRQPPSASKISLSNSTSDASAGPFDATGEQTVATVTDSCLDTEGENSSVTRPLCSSSSPESDHNYAKSDYEESDSVKGGIGRKCIRKGAASTTPQAATGSESPGEGNDGFSTEGLGALSSGQSLGRRRVLRGNTSKPPADVKASLSSKTTGGKLGSSSLTGLSADKGKKPISQSRALKSGQEKIEKCMTGEPGCFEIETEDLSSDLRSFNQNPVRTDISKAASEQKHTKPTAIITTHKKKHMHIIKKRLPINTKRISKETLPSHASLNRSETVDEEELPALTHIMPRLRKAHQKDSGRNLFEQFSGEYSSDAEFESETERSSKHLSVETTDIKRPRLENESNPASQTRALSDNSLVSVPKVGAASNQKVEINLSLSSTYSQSRNTRKGTKDKIPLEVDRIGTITNTNESNKKLFRHYSKGQDASFSTNVDTTRQHGSSLNPTPSMRKSSRHSKLTRVENLEINARFINNVKDGVSEEADDKYRSMSNDRDESDERLMSPSDIVCKMSLGSPDCSPNIKSPVGDGADLGTSCSSSGQIPKMGSRWMRVQKSVAEANSPKEDQDNSSQATLSRRPQMESKGSVSIGAGIPSAATEGEAEISQQSAVTSSPSLRRARGRPRKSTAVKDTLTTDVKGLRDSPDMTPSVASPSTLLSAVKNISGNSIRVASSGGEISAPRGREISEPVIQRLSDREKESPVSPSERPEHDVQQTEDSGSNALLLSAETSTIEINKDTLTEAKLHTTSPSDEMDVRYSNTTGMRRTRGRPRKDASSSELKRESEQKVTDRQLDTLNKNQACVELTSKGEIALVEEVKPMQMMTRRKSAVKNYSEERNECDSKGNETSVTLEVMKAYSVEELDSANPENDGGSDEKQSDTIMNLRKRGKARRDIETYEKQKPPNKERKTMELKSPDDISAVKVKKSDGITADGHLAADESTTETDQNSLNDCSESSVGESQGAVALPSEGTLGQLAFSTDVTPESLETSSEPRGVMIDDRKAKQGKGRGRQKKRRGRSKIGTTQAEPHHLENAPVELPQQDVMKTQSVEKVIEVEHDTAGTESSKEEHKKDFLTNTAASMLNMTLDGEVKLEKKSEENTNSVVREETNNSNSPVCCAVEGAQPSNILMKMPDVQSYASDEVKDSSSLPTSNDDRVTEVPTHEDGRANLIACTEDESSDKEVEEVHGMAETKVPENSLVDRVGQVSLNFDMCNEAKSSNLSNVNEQSKDTPIFSNQGPSETKTQLFEEPRNIDDLQVPFHDTDEAEITDPIYKLERSNDKSYKTNAVTSDTEESLNLFLSTDDTDRERLINKVESTVEEKELIGELQPETENKLTDLLRPTCQGGLSGVETKDLTACIDIEQASRIIEKESESPTKILTDLSPGKSEWSARKVKEGVKIVLKLKRKSSSDRGEGSTPTTPTSASQSDFTDVNSTSEERPDTLGKRQYAKHESVTNVANSEPLSEISLSSSVSEEVKQKKKKRRNEFDLLNVTERSYQKKKKPKLHLSSESQLGLLDSTDSEISELTSDSISTLGTQSVSFLDKDGMLQEVMNVEDVKKEISVPEEDASAGCAQIVNSAPIMSPQQKVEKLVIKRRIPSPTKMKTRGKQNRLWYLFAKQSKPSKASKKDKPHAPKTSALVSGTIDELMPLCKPCNVKMIDLIKYLNILSHESGSHGELSPESSTGGSSPSQDTFSDNFTSGSPTPVTSLESDLAEAQNDLSKSARVTLSKKRLLPESPESSPTPEARMVKIPWPGSGSSSPAAKKSKLEPRSEGERQFLSFIMPKPAQEQSISTCTQEIIACPKPVLSRAPVTARKSMKSTSSARKSMLSSKSENVQLGESLMLHSVSPLKSRTTKFSCLHCSFTSSVRSVMSQHVYSHADIMPYSCGQCDNWRGSRSSVQFHSKQAHPGMPVDIVKNAEICEEDYYITCDASKNPLPETAGLSSRPHSERFDIPCLRPDQIKTVPSVLKKADGYESKAKAISLLNPAALTAQVAATKAGIPAKNTKPPLTRQTEPESSFAQLVPTSRPITTAPVVNVVAQVNPAVLPQSAQANPKAIAGKESLATKVKIPRRPRIPLLDNVDPSQPYYQCRHCTHASNSLQCINSHVASQHKGEQCYQCPLCEHTYFKSVCAVDKHNSKYHPNETVKLQLQADFYDVNQSDNERTVYIVETSRAGLKYQDVLSPQGQSPLHVIVSPDGVTVLGSSDTSTASVKCSPQVSPVHMQVAMPQPVLSPPPRSLSQTSAPSPPLARSPRPSVAQARTSPATPSASVKQTPRVILKVPTISPPQRVAVPMSSQSVTHVPIKGTCGSSGMGPRKILPVLSLPIIKTAESTEASPDLCAADKTPMSSVPTSEKPPSPTASNVGTVPPKDVQPEPSTTELIDGNQQIDSGDGNKSLEENGSISIDESNKADDASVSVPTHPEIADSPPPLMILNVVSLAGQREDCIGTPINEDVIHDPNLEETDVPKEADDSKTYTESGKNVEIPQLPESYSCKFCDKIFAHIDDVIDHIAETHKMRYWYACPYCPFGCSRHKSNMLRHIARAHQGESDDVQITITDEEQYFTRVLGITDRQFSLDSVNRSPPIEIDDDLDIDIPPVQQNTKAEKVQSSPDLKYHRPASSKPSKIEEIDTPSIKTEPVDETMIEPKTSEKSCSTDDMVSNKNRPVKSGVAHHEEDDNQVGIEPRKQRPVGEIKPTLVRAPLNIPSTFNRVGSAGRQNVPPQRRVKTAGPDEITSDKSKTADSELDMDCEDLSVSRTYSDGTEDDVIITETHSSVISMPQIDQPLDLQVTRSSGVLDQPTDLSFSPVSCMPQDLSKRRQHRPVNVAAKTSVTPQAGHLKTDPDEKVMKTPPPAHQSTLKYSKPPLVIAPTPSPPSCIRSRPLNEPIMIAPLADSPKTSHGRLSSPTVRKPQPAHSNKKSIREVSPGKNIGTISKSQGVISPSAVAVSTSLAARNVQPPVQSKSGRPHRPVSKTMPPLIRIEPRKTPDPNSQISPHIAFHTSQANDSTDGPGKTIVEKTLSNEPQSALSSLEMMTKRGVDALQTGSAIQHTKRSSVSDTVKRLIDDRYADEEAARKAFSVFNLKPNKVKKSKPVAVPTSASVSVQSSVQNTLLNIPQVPVGINKWRQFQSKNRPAIHQPNTFGGFQSAPPGSLGMAATAFQQAHLRRTAPLTLRQSVRPHMSPATAAAAAASFMQRPAISASQSAFSSTASHVATSSVSQSTISGNIPCPYCSYEAEDADAIHDHILSHEPTIQIHWSCPYCPLPNRMSKPSVTKHIQNCHPKSNVVYIPYGVPLQ